VLKILPQSHKAFADRVPPIALAMAQASAKEQSFFEG